MEGAGNVPCPEVCRQDKSRLKDGYMIPANNQFLALSPTTKYSIAPAKGERIVVTYILLKPGAHCFLPPCSPQQEVLSSPSLCLPRACLPAPKLHDQRRCRLFLAVQANPKHVLASFDVSNAFLNAELSEDVIILTQPAPQLIQFGLVKPGTLYQCTKACYGLREAPKLWEEARDKTLTSFVFRIDRVEYSLRQSTYQSMVCCSCTMSTYAEESSLTR